MGITKASTCGVWSPVTTTECRWTGSGTTTAKSTGSFAPSSIQT